MDFDGSTCLIGGKIWTPDNDVISVQIHQRLSLRGSEPSLNPSATVLDRYLRKCKV